MALQPLTHHEIIGLIEPFTRRGRHVDLGESNRLERKLQFKRVVHAAGDGALPDLAESLQLENPAPSRYRLTRVLSPAGGPAASLVAEGADAGELLDRVQAVAPDAQFRNGDKFMIAASHRLEAGAAPMILTRALAMIDGLTLELKMPAVSGMPADLVLSAPPGASADFPEDLLAVLGWRWTRLIRGKEDWRASLRLQGKGAARSRHAEDKLESAARHLAQTLAEPPARFHQQRVLARWGVFARRAIPLVAVIALIAGGIAIPSLNLAEDSVVRMLIFNSPPLLMILVFGMREVPRIEIPPVPRASSAKAWRTPAAAPAGERTQAGPQRTES